MTGIIYGTTLHVMHIFQALWALVAELIKILENDAINIAVDLTFLIV